MCWGRDLRTLNVPCIVGQEIFAEFFWVNLQQKNIKNILCAYVNTLHIDNMEIANLLGTQYVAICRPELHVYKYSACQHKYPFPGNRPCKQYSYCRLRNR